MLGMRPRDIKTLSKYVLLMTLACQKALPFVLQRNLPQLHTPKSGSHVSQVATRKQQWMSMKEAPSSSDGNTTIIITKQSRDDVQIENRVKEEEKPQLSDILDFAQVLSLDELPPAIRNATSAAADLFSKAPNPPVCRVVTRAGSKLPNDPSILPKEVYQSPFNILDKLGLYYHAQARQITTSTKYIDAISNGQQPHPEEEKENLKQLTNTTSPSTTTENINGMDATEDVPVTSVLRRSLEDAGYELLSRRDIDLCESLNAGYLLRLSILPDVSQLDSSMAAEFYPEKFHSNGTLRDESDLDDLLFDGRVLVFWRGYSQEITRGRLLLPKIDYLQASLVQRSAAWVKRKIDDVEVELFRKATKQSQRFRKAIRRWTKLLVKRLQVRKLASKIRKGMTSLGDHVDGDVVPGVDLVLDEDGDDDDNKIDCTSAARLGSGSIRLSRYGGSKIRFVGSPNPNDALDPFTICEYNYDDCNQVATNGTLKRQISSKFSTNATVALCEHDLYEEVNHNPYTCEYDARSSLETKGKVDKLPRMQLLERVSISNLVDLFTKEGRREVLKSIFSKSRLVEPTYEEVVVVWRPLVKQKKRIVPPRFVSEFADMFDIEGFEQPLEEEVNVPLSKLEIRLFEQVPMSNLPAVLPKTKLVFRPADAFLFDFISLVTLTLVLSSVKFDSSKLDILAIASVTFWVFRTIIRYSNKLARYDLLVKTFLTSKISQRNAGAFKYLTYEAASQRAIRSALILAWISSKMEREPSAIPTRDALELDCTGEVNKLLKTDKEVQLNATRALQDLEELQLLLFVEGGQKKQSGSVLESSAETVKRLWSDMIEEEEG